MDRKEEFRILGVWSNIASLLLTIIACLPLPILILFFKNRTKYFSIYGNYQQYVDGVIGKDSLNKRNKFVLIRLIVISIVLLFVSYILFTENSTDSFEIRGNYIAVCVFLSLLIPCFYLSYMVRRKVNNLG